MKPITHILLFFIILTSSNAQADTIDWRQYIIEITTTVLLDKKSYTLKAYGVALYENSIALNCHSIRPDKYFPELKTATVLSISATHPDSGKTINISTTSECETEQDLAIVDVIDPIDLTGPPPISTICRGNASILNSRDLVEDIISVSGKNKHGPFLDILTAVAPGQSGSLVTCEGMLVGLIEGTVSPRTIDTARVVLISSAL